MGDKQPVKSGHSVIERGNSLFATIMLLAWPIIMEQFMMTLVQYADTAMVGSLGALATAAVAINMSSINLLNAICMGCGVGFTALVARSIGAGDFERAKAFAGQALILVAALGGTFTVGMIALSPHIPRWMGGEEEILKEASTYLFIIALTMFFKAASIILNSILRGAGDTHTPMRVNILVNLINVVGNFFLIYQTRTINILGVQVSVWGAGMGVAGAAAATSFSVFIGGLMVLYVLFFTDTPVRITSDVKLRPDRELMGITMRISLPTVGERLAMSIGQIMVTYIVTALGTVSLAAHHLSITAESICFMPAFAFSAAATTLVGQSLGAKREDLAEKLSMGVIKISVAGLIIMGTVLYLGGEYMIRFFTADAAVIALATECLKIVAFAQPFVAIAMAITGALRGAGDTRWPLIVVLISMWSLRITTAYMLCIKLGYGLQGMWFCMVLDFALRSAILGARYRSGKWKHVMAKAEAKAM